MNEFLIQGHVTVIDLLSYRMLSMRVKCAVPAAGTPRTVHFGDSPSLHLPQKLKQNKT